MMHETFSWNGVGLTLPEQQCALLEQLKRDVCNRRQARHTQ
jgi:hypothetical protein